MELYMYHVIVQFIAADDIFPMVSLQTEKTLIALTDLMAVSKGKIFGPQLRKDPWNKVRTKY